MMKRQAEADVRDSDDVRVQSASSWHSEGGGNIIGGNLVFSSTCAGKTTCVKALSTGYPKTKGGEIA